MAVFLMLFVSPVENNSGVTPAGLCGSWVKDSDGGVFTSPNYPEKYPPDRECIYIIEGYSAYILIIVNDSYFYI